MVSSGKRRSTLQRRMILEEVKKSKFHPTAEDVYNSVRKKLPRISLGTIYRNLELLSNDGDIVKLDSLDSKRRYDHVCELHYHAICLDCDKIEDIYPEDNRLLLNEVARYTDYQITRHEAIFYGICEDCQIRVK